MCALLLLPGVVTLSVKLKVLHMFKSQVSLTIWEIFCLFLFFQYSILPDYYKFIVVTIVILITLIEAIRLYLGYMGNLQEKVGSSFLSLSATHKCS